MSTLELRPYQRAAIDGIYRWFEVSTGNPLVVLPTGTGKSLVQAAFVQEAIQAWPETRILAATHVRELITQNFAALCRLWEFAPAGIYSAGVGRRDIDAQILFCGIQSIHKRAYEIQRCDLLIVDEAHLIPTKGKGMYLRFIQELRSINPCLKVIGLTATPYRLDSGRLDQGKNALFDGIAYEAPVLEMIKQGYLCPPVPKATQTLLDVAGVATRGGEFVAGDLERAVDTDEANSAAVAEILQQGEDRGSWLIFCSGVSHAHHIAERIRAAGVSCETVTGDTPKPERDRILSAFKAGRLRAVTNANVLTTGFDAPGVDLIALLRPTKSTGLYVQMVGRGTRLAEGKENCLVLDFAGNTARHGPIDKVNPRKPGGGEGEAPTKECPECRTICFAGVRHCPTCDFAFPEPEIDISRKASTGAMLSTQQQSEWVEIDDVDYALHEKIGKPSSMVVTYRAGFTWHREWICLEHSGYPREKACRWWARRRPGETAPIKVDKALSQIEAEGLPAPLAILVRPSGRYTDILDYRFE